MRSGELDNAIIASGIAALREPRRKNLLRRRNLWQLREQVLAKARARSNNQGVLRLFEMLNEIYARDWRERYDQFLNEEAEEKIRTAVKASPVSPQDSSATMTVGNANVDLLMSEARQIRMRMVLMGAVDGKDRPDSILNARGPRLDKKTLAEFLPVPQTFDKALAELPPLVVVPGSGRGFFAWETGMIMLALRPLVGVDDSVATAFAWYRMLDDRINRGGVLRQAFEKKFPGAVFQNDFPADYRAWLTRLSKGEVGAMNPQRRAFFRDHIGPDISGPLLPPNLRNIGPQTMVAICRRLEKQLSSGDNDVNLHRRLAALYWQQGNLEAAGLQFNAAMQLAPDDGETMFAAGMFMRSRGDGEAANGCFRYGAERAKNSLWGIYCQDALANQL
jgi:tetratricopeptide (TPR) repeat protein